MSFRQVFGIAACLALALVALDLMLRLEDHGAQLRQTGLFWLAGLVLPPTVWSYGGPLTDALFRYHSFASPLGRWSFLAMAYVANAVAATGGVLVVLGLRFVLGRRRDKVASSRPRPLGGAFRVATTGALLLAILSFGWIGARHFGPAGGPAIGRPNVLLVSIDTLRADHLSAYGHSRPTSPSIDALAAQGALFQQAISPSSWTLPTHATMLTGIPLPHHGLNSDRAKLTTSVVTLAEVFLGAGYSTAAFVSAAWLHPRYGFDQGFELFDFSADSNADARSLVSSPTLERLTVEWLDQWSGAQDRRPFFVFLHMWDPHWHYIPPSPYDHMFDPEYEGDLNGVNFLDRIGPTRDGKLSERDFEHLLALYDGEIRFTDHHLGRVLSRLEELGELDDTVILVTSDHGEEFFEHGRVGHAMTLYDESVRVPLIIRYPAKVPPGTLVEQQVRTMDIPATLLSLAGVPVPDSFGLKAEGVEFRSIDLSRWIEHRPALPRLPLHGDLHGNILSLRSETSKFIYEAKFDYPQYFDLTTDPGEQRNLAQRETERTEALRRQLERFNETATPARLAEPSEPDENHLERLRTLGYIK